MANPFFEPYTPYPYPQYPPWMYQQSYPFPGFRQTGACPQHGAFYGHGACFQPPQNLPAAESPADFQSPPNHTNPATTTSSPTTKQPLVLPGINAVSRPSPTNILSPRAENFVPIFGQHIVSSIGSSDTAYLKNRNTGQGPIVNQKFHLDHNPLVLAHATGQAEIGYNTAPIKPEPGRSVRHTPRQVSRLVGILLFFIKSVCSKYIASGRFSAKVLFASAEFLSLCKSIAYKFYVI